MVEMACLDLLGVMGFLDLQDPKGMSLPLTRTFPKLISM